MGLCDLFRPFHWGHLMLCEIQCRLLPSVYFGISEIIALSGFHWRVHDRSLTMEIAFDEDSSVSMQSGPTTSEMPMSPTVLSQQASDFFISYLLCYLWNHRMPSRTLKHCINGCLAAILVIWNRDCSGLVSLNLWHILFALIDWIKKSLRFSLWFFLSCKCFNM